MIALNLLSPSEKKGLLIRVQHSIIERLMFMLIASTLAASLLVTLVKAELAKDLAGVISRQVLSKEYSDVNESTRQMNETIARVEALQKLAYPVSAVIEAVAKDAPAGVTVTGLDLDARTGEMRITGGATDREALLAYEQTIRALPIVKGFDSPISNLFQKQNITFQFHVTIDDDKVRAIVDPHSP